MAWTDLKAAVAAVIRANGNQEITGALLQSTLNSIIDQVGANASYKGRAIPSTNPGTPDSLVFYIASTQGTYANFGGFVLDGGFAVLSNVSGSWSGTKFLKTELDAKADRTELDQLAGTVGTLAINNIFRPDQTGTRISAIKKAVRNIYFNFPKIENRRYFFTVLRRNHIASGGATPSSEIRFFSTDMDGVSNLESVSTYNTAGDPNTNTYQLLNFRNTYVLIDWQYLADNTGFTSMFAGYELDDMCFDKRNPIAMSLSIQAIPYPKYPYKETQVGTRIPQLIKAIKNVFINPDIVDTNKTYSISAVRRNNIASGQAQKTSQIDIWSRNNSDGAIALIQRWVINGDAANGSNQILDSSNVRVLINWDALPDNYSAVSMITSVIGNYELDEMCFDKRNALYQGTVDLSKNELFYDKPALTDGFIDTRYGTFSPSGDFGSTDYIPVYPGQIIRYVGGMYGNAGICGYPTKSTTGFVVLHNSSIETNNTDFEFTIPVGVNYIRACCYKQRSPTIELYYYKSYNYALFASVGLTENIEVLNIIFKGGQLEIKSLIADTEHQKSRWIELKDNYDFPSTGIFIGRQNEDVVISINGVITKLNP